MKNITLLLFAVPFLPVVLAGYEGMPIGGEPYASWEKGAIDYFVMFNSLVDDQVTLYGEEENRQGDTCLLESSFALSGLHVPDDAIVTQAYLVWMGAVDPANFAAPTDNAVHLKFTHASSGYTYEEDELAGDTAKMLGDTADPFLFQSVQFNADVTTGCTETEPGTSSTADVAYFTYRTDITQFFQKIFDDNRISEEPVLDGEALYGDYTFSGLDCTAADIYKCRTTMVSNWSIVVVYQSAMTRPQKVYMYPGLAYVQGETMTAQVSGFSFPSMAKMRLTTMIADGDPALTNSQLPPEIIYIKGEDATSTYFLTNECNPLEGMVFEVYNSNSSMIGWDTETPTITCVSGGSDGHYYGVDADTFYLDSQEDINLMEHLKLSATKLDITLSVNQDAILSNYLMVAVDNKRPRFDIPPEASLWPYDREKEACTCRREDDLPDAFCEGRAMYYLIKVQNWGSEIAQNVTVIDELSSYVDYMPDSTEMATRFDENGNGYDWIVIPDKMGEGSEAFPLSSEGYKVADTMDICNQITWTCTDTRLIRFKVKVKNGLPKPTVIPNIAIIKEAGGDEAKWYRTNRYIPLSLRKGSCLDVAECPEPTKAECGGDIIIEKGCDEDWPCPDGYVCDLETGFCVLENPCTDTEISFDVGPNSPYSDGAPTIIPAGTQKFIVGQFKINAETCVATKFYKFVSLRTSILKGDPNVQLNNIELIYDKNGSGTVDKDEEVIATVVTSYGSEFYFVIDSSNNIFNASEWHHFIIRADVNYDGSSISSGATFQFAIDGPESFMFEDAGTPTAVGDPIAFTAFEVEPTGSHFIVTRGLHDPIQSWLPGGDFALLQLRIKSINKPGTITQMTVSVPESSGDSYVSFGEHRIRALSLYADIDGDGVPEGEPLATVSKFSDTDMADFKGEHMESYLTFDQDDEKHLIISVDLSNVDKETVKIGVDNGSVVFSGGSKAVEGLPVWSQEFYHDCCPCGECEEPDTDQPPSCSCSLVF